MSETLKNRRQWSYANCLCGMLVRTELVNEQLRTEMGLPGPAYFGICPQKGCNLQVSVGFAPAQLIARPSGPVPGPVPA